MARYRRSRQELTGPSVEQPVGAGVLGSLLRPAAVRREERNATRRALAMLDRLQLARVADLPASALSGGQQKLLALGAALLGQPKMLLLDEPTAGVNPALRRELVDTLLQVRRDGVTLVIVEHDMGFIRSLCDRCVVLDRGSVIADCAPSSLVTDERVVNAYLGRRGRAALQLLEA